jgi:3,4-dihydroxy 2-butanone 4-phosphate synthase/GTP cyclohydrolase II
MKCDDVLVRFAKGDIVVVFDHESRENEADLIVAVDKATQAQVNFLIREARGLLCVAVGADFARSKGLPRMSSMNQERHGTGFTLSIDSRRARTGISAAERLITAQDLVRPGSMIGDFVSPGHLFPVVARDGGLLERDGHTEAAVTLCQWAGMTPAAFMCEMIGPDGGMLNRQTAEAFAQQNGLAFCDMKDLVGRERRLRPTVRRVADACLPTRFGTFGITVYEEPYTKREHVFLRMGDPSKGPIRVHSECLTGDAFGSRTCDCGDQLGQAMERVAREGHGGIVYLRQEGRGIGLGQKIKAYALQQNDGMDTVEANLALGHGDDERDYDSAAWMLKDQGVVEVSLMTNNPDKVDGLRRHGLIVTRLAHEMPPCQGNFRYMKTKQDKMGHVLTFPYSDARSVTALEKEHL